MWRGEGGGGFLAAIFNQTREFLCMGTQNQLYFHILESKQNKKSPRGFFGWSKNSNFPIYRWKFAKKISHFFAFKSSILIFSSNEEGLKISVHTDFQHNPLKNKARRRHMLYDSHTPLYWHLYRYMNMFTNGDFKLFFVPVPAKKSFALSVSYRLSEVRADSKNSFTHRFTIYQVIFGHALRSIFFF